MRKKGFYNIDFKDYIRNWFYFKAKKNSWDGDVQVRANGNEIYFVGYNNNKWKKVY